MNVKSIALTLATLTILTSTPLAAECLNCIKWHQETQANGCVVEWVEKKCGALQKHIHGKTCPGCKCPRDKHTKRVDEYAYHNGKKLTATPLGKVDVGTIMPGAGA